MTARANSAFNLVLIVLAYAGLACHAQTTEPLFNQNEYLLKFVNKSHELFKDSNLISQRDSFRLKCALPVRSLTDHSALTEANSLHVRWFKLDANLNLQKEYFASRHADEPSIESLIDEEAADLSDNVFVSSASQLPTNKSSNAQKLTSILVFKFKNAEDLSRAGGFYLCRLADKNVTSLTKSRFEETQYIQQIVINGELLF
jgi:hypothetical protein